MIALLQNIIILIKSFMLRMYLKILLYFFNNYADTNFISNISVRVEKLVSDIYDVSSDSRQNALFTDISNTKNIFTV
ncbi:hypothetical protein BGI05_07040 [Snodgrassella alvi]|nr:hypothetical protein BGH97_08050 [Snodgrassella alvi]ORF07827.1 hypothetical protein BGH99_07330 [Snodgrassella alvi]ORF12067.1 hypothetical protein BGI00_06020 [Snodgrassella alvi]ORF12959.1 hypothetical protein BGI02_08005 [Snodgrassella alvi]ORF20131.1 hypothetical protein BGI05_07040 [Snodgrassella alvi]